MSVCATKNCGTVFDSMFRSETPSYGLALLMLLGTPMGWGGEKIEPPFERAALTEVSNAGRPMEPLVRAANRMLQLHNPKLAVILWINNRWRE